jgi:hypothetical protein
MAGGMQRRRRAVTTPEPSQARSARVDQAPAHTTAPGLPTAGYADDGRVSKHSVKRSSAAVWLSAVLVLGGCSSTTVGTGQATRPIVRATPPTSAATSTGQSSESAPTPPASGPEPATPSAAGATLARLLSRFAGKYAGHGHALAIAADGSGTITYRVYKWCSDDPTPPCDDMQGNNIIDGGQITFVLRSAFAAGTSTIGEGVITSSTDPTMTQGQPLTARRSGYIVALSTGGTFCAPNTPPKEWVCGA